MKAEISIRDFENTNGWKPFAVEVLESRVIAGEELFLHRQYDPTDKKYTKKFLVSHLKTGWKLRLFPFATKTAAWNHAKNVAPSIAQSLKRLDKPVVVRGEYFEDEVKP